MDVSSLIGNYLVEGTNQNQEETKYEGSLTLSIRTDGQLNAVWHINPDQMQYGVGFFKNEMLVVHFHYVGDDHSNYHGVVAYTCASNGRLNGIWSEEAGDSKFVGVENGTKIQTAFLN